MIVKHDRIPADDNFPGEIVGERSLGRTHMGLPREQTGSFKAD